MNSKKLTSPQSQKSGIETSQSSALVVEEGQCSCGATHGSLTDTERAALIKRLTASVADHEQEQVDMGAWAGRIWAKHEAETVELERLGDPNPFWRVKNGHEESVFSEAELFFFTIRPDEAGDQLAAASFWKVVAGTRQTPNERFVRAFADAAVAIFDDVVDCVL